jgi:hypothetical protein
MHFRIIAPMRSINYWPRHEIPTLSPDDSFERLRKRFYRCLTSDRAQLLLMTAELGDADLDAIPSYRRIAALAHRICGAAGLFDHRTIGGAASILELAATNAIKSHSNNQNESVWQAITSLAEILPRKTAEGTIAAKRTSPAR